MKKCNQCNAFMERTEFGWKCSKCDYQEIIEKKEKIIDFDNENKSQLLKELQRLPLERKIQISITRIIEWHQHYNGNVCVSFSGGKDSTVILDLVRKMYPDVKGVFLDTGLEYPEVKNFIKTIDNIDWIYPVSYNKNTRKYDRITFKEILIEYGYPIISKDFAHAVECVKNNTDSNYMKKFDNNSEYCKKYGEKYCYEDFKYLLDSDFKISAKCCQFMKKNSLHRYMKENNLVPYIGLMASDSKLRRTAWMHSGCNAFNNQFPHSAPISIWTREDVLEYIDKYKIPYCDIYGDIVTDAHGWHSTTKARNTGCMFCLFGILYDDDENRFVKMKETHPKIYDYCINGGKYENGLWIPDEKGLGIGHVLDTINVRKE